MDFAIKSVLDTNYRPIKEDNKEAVAQEIRKLGMQQPLFLFRFPCSITKKIFFYSINNS